jgi:hypothetical protein
MSLTQLPNRKSDAYTVDIQLEAREKILPSSIKATTWDLHGNRLLYTRDVWRYKVLAGSNTIQDFGHVDTEVMAIPADQLPMSSAAQGTRVTLIDHIPVDAPQSNSSLRIPEVLAADPTTGNWIIYSHRIDVGPPYITDLAAFTPTGAPISRTSLVQPDDVGLRWEVPHAILQDGFLYAIERDFRHNTGGSNATALVVRRQIGTVGSLTIYWSPDDEWLFPHSVSVSEEHVFVAATKLFNPGGFGTFQRSYLYWLNNETLAQADVRQLKFNPTDNDFPRPFKVGGWEPTGSRNTGGIVLYDRQAGNFLAAGISPNGYNPDWFEQSPTHALFRFAPALLGDQPFVHLADIADDLPIPMSFTATGVCANDTNQLPEFRDL